MTNEPPDLSPVAEMLNLAAQSVNQHPPGLHPVDIIGAARYGFTTEQGQAVLADIELLDLLTRQWRSRPPSGVVAGVAHSPGLRGQTHLQLLERTGQLIRLASQTQYGLAASTGQGPENLVDDSIRDHGTIVTRSLFNDQGLLDIVIESEIEATGRFPVVALHSLADSGLPQSLLLLLLIPTPPGHPQASHSESRVQIDSTLTSDQLSLFPWPINAIDLPGHLLALVSQSVAAAKLPWKEGWRRAALATPDGHPLRTAVTDGLTGRM